MKTCKVCGRKRKKGYFNQHKRQCAGGKGWEPKHKNQKR